ncbi:hypothetical protein F7725_004838 [Dissostichus mawsoni]|uniref:Uncharacterized protein n=1 Tax=Dissostichus mawsoni TaxID=36200 RepID=A0A7J5XJZ5_DISMA|nr:hypothetical protein F7725_004838 [Dissostichus mawsoni]
MTSANWKFPETKGTSQGDLLLSDYAKCSQWLKLRHQKVYAKGCMIDLQWGQLSRPYSSTDRSSSLGSMESLDTPTPTPQTYSDSHISPVDPTLFNNKRDSAYSSFSASSNTSDYATATKAR